MKWQRSQQKGMFYAHGQHLDTILPSKLLQVFHRQIHLKLADADFDGHFPETRGTHKPGVLRVSDFFLGPTAQLVASLEIPDQRMGI